MTQRESDIQKGFDISVGVGRFYAVGDIHGRNDLLLKMLHLIAQDVEKFDKPEHAQIVFLGDYIDRGDESSAVIHTLRDCEQKTGVKCCYLLGNHEEAMLDFLADPIKGRAWLDYGAAQTLASYGVRPPVRALDEAGLVDLRDTLQLALGSDLDFFKSLQPYFISGSVICTHAGLAPEDIGKWKNTQAMVWGHADSLCDTPVPGYLLVHGHYDDATPVLRLGRVCVDTGAYYSGKLSAVCIHNDLKIIST